eukprot:353183-Chlamydomonas_euryale.AAC.4
MDAMLPRNILRSAITGGQGTLKTWTQKDMHCSCCMYYQQIEPLRFEDVDALLTGFLLKSLTLVLIQLQVDDVLLKANLQFPGQFITTTSPAVTLYGRLVNIELLSM